MAHRYLRWLSPRRWLPARSSTTSTIAPFNVTTTVAESSDELEPGEMKAMQGGIGPLTFAGSRYGLALLVMAVVLNRVHHLVRRPAGPQDRNRTMTGLLLLPFSHLFASPAASALLRVPGILALLQSWVLLSVVVLQVAGWWPVTGILGEIRILNRLGEWADSMAMAEVCWNIFLSVCLSLVGNNVARGLEQRLRDDVPAFNLFGLSYLLHLYSSHLTHRAARSPGGFGRPDFDALFELWLCITEVTFLQALELSEKWRKRRLIPTAACGVLGLAHFIWSLIHNPGKLPTFMFLSYSMALSSILITLLTISLTALTQVFTLGGINLQSLLPHSATMPSLSEDWNVCITRLGTACMTTSRYSAGLRNEVAPAEIRPSWVDLEIEGVRPLKETRGNIIGQDHEVPGFHHEMISIHAAAPTEVATPHAIFGWMSRSLTSQPDAYGREFWRFIDAAGSLTTGFIISCWRCVPGSTKAETFALKAWNRRWWYGPRKWVFWRRSAWVIHPPSTPATASTIRTVDIESLATQSPLTTPVGNRSSVARPFVLREASDESDDDSDEDWSVQHSRETSVFSEASFTSDATVTADDRDTEDGPANLMADLLSSSGSGPSRTPTRTRLDLIPFDASLQPVLLAHMTSSSPGPLTRRSYSRLLAQTSPATPTASEMPVSGIERYIDILQDRRIQASTKEVIRDEDDEERKRMCVVCTVEPRDTILWPCRCLALCSECRENLADRLPAKQHMCPCCRRKVEGYSRIFLP